VSSPGDLFTPREEILLKRKSAEFLRETGPNGLDGWSGRSNLKNSRGVDCFAGLALSRGLDTSKQEISPYKRWPEKGNELMNTENAVKAAVGFFVIILVGALLSALVGGAFGALVATISPEFVTGLFSPKSEAGIVRYASVVGMIWGVFIGAVVSGFACFLAAVIKILRIRFEYRKEREANTSEPIHQ